MLMGSSFGNKNLRAGLFAGSRRFVVIALLLLLAASFTALACDPTRGAVGENSTQPQTGVSRKEPVEPITHTRQESKKDTASASRKSARRERAGAKPEAASRPKVVPRPPPGSCNDLLVLVDRKYGLPRGYTPGPLVNLSAFGVPTTSGDERLRLEAAVQLRRLVAAAGKSGRELVVGSAYRSYRDQQFSYGHWRKRYGSGAGNVSAPPGHSEHQLGTAVDFTNKAASYEVRQIFGYTKASKWLSRHAYEYGFVLSYPENEKSKTGYIWEPWHYRYIGEENARRFHKSGLLLRSFLTREGVRPRCGRS